MRNQVISYQVRDWSLITGRGGGGHVKFYPYGSSHIEGGGDTKSFHSLKWGAAKCFTLPLGGGGSKKPFCSPPPP